MLVGDGFRWLIDITVHGLALIAAAAVFIRLWGTEVWWIRIAAFPAAFAVLAAVFPLAVMLVALLVARRVKPGRYDIRKREAFSWIAAESLMLIVHRSFLRGYIEDFGPPRYLFYRLLGAKIDRSFFLGGEARMLDPWALEVGSGTIIGAFSVISGHALEGNSLIIKPVKIGNCVTVGVRSMVLPGVEIGDGAIVGAGALVPKDTRIPPNEIWAGVPAKKIGVVTDVKTRNP